MNLAPVVDLLERRIGLDPASLGSRVLPTAVAEGMRAVKLTDPVAYAGHLLEHVDELDELVERLLVPETWFFRGAGLFAALARVVSGFPAGRTFRALSVPCSSGEEPYSFAIALLEAAVAPARWSIDAYDLSPRSIAVAEHGVYGEFSFRETATTLRERYFRRTADGWELATHVRERVRFGVGNLIDTAFLAGVTTSYDLILCRNVLIYLTPTARRQVVATLERVLKPGGLLAVGPAEPQALIGRPFRREGTEPYFLFHYEPGEASILPPPRIDQLSLIPNPRRLPPRRRLPDATPAVARQSDVQTLPESPLDRARRFADAGRLDDALTEAAKAGPSADAFSLVGVIQQARGDRAAAAAAFRKALYLEPDHREALTYAMLIADHEGDADRAAVLRERLARSGGKS
jgi:chemotaxis protein methyltransferase WspC